METPELPARQVVVTQTQWPSPSRMHPQPVNEDVEPPKPWEQQPGERAKPWAAFVIYRDLGMERSYSEVARRLTGTLPNPNAAGPSAAKLRPRSMGRVMAWAKEYNWKLRAEAFDRFLDDQRIKKQVDDQRAMVDRHITLGGMLQAKAAKKLREMSDDDLKNMRPSDLMKFIIEGAKLERLSRGMPTVNVASSPSEGEEETRSEVRATREALMRRLDDIASKKSVISMVPVSGEGQADATPSTNRFLAGMGTVEIEDADHAGNN